MGKARQGAGQGEANGLCSLGDNRPGAKSGAHYQTCDIKPMGRPRKHKARYPRIGLRLDPDAIDLLNQLSESTGETRIEVVNRLIREESKRISKS